MKNSPGQQYLDVEAIAEYLGITERHLRELVYRRDVPYHKVGRLLRFHVDDIDAWMLATRTPATSANPSRVTTEDPFGLGSAFGGGRP